MDAIFKVGDIKALIKESTNEFKAKLGSDVVTANKSNNNKAYKEAEKRAKDYDGGLSKEMGSEKPKYEKNDNNGTLLDYNVENEPEGFKDKVEAQVNGYTSKLEKDNKIEKTGDFSDNKEIFKAIKKSGKETHDMKKTLSKSGLQAREWPEEVFTDNKNEMYEHKIKKAKFKKTEFLTENHMISKIPDEFKREGEIFEMIDKTDNSYIIEWKNNKANIINHSNKQGMNESLSRMKALFNYNSNDLVKGMSNKDKIIESNESISNSLNNIRKIIK